PGPRLVRDRPRSAPAGRARAVRENNMTYAIRSTAGAAASAALLAAVNLLLDVGLDRSCCRWWGRGPDARVAAAEPRCLRAGEVARAAAAGRLTLLEAAARLRDLRAEVPGGNPDACDDEYYCRDVIRRASRVLDDDPARAEEVAARLSAELEEHLRRGTL